jgi:hypothetical protein
MPASGATLSIGLLLSEFLGSRTLMLEEITYVLVASPCEWLLPRKWPIVRHGNHLLIVYLEMGLLVDLRRLLQRFSRSARLKSLLLLL